MMNHIMYALYIILGIAPFSAVRIYPFYDKLRVKPSCFWCIYSAVVAIEVVWFIAIEQGNAVLGVSDNELLRLVFYVVYLIVSLVFINEIPSKHLIVWAVCVIFASTFTAFSFCMDMLFPSQIPFLVKNITMVALLPFFVWFCFWFVNHYIMPLINQSNKKTNRLISTLLMLIIVMVLVTVRELPAQSSRPWAVFGVRVLACAITLIVCYIFSEIINEQKQIQNVIKENKQKEKMLEVSTQQFIALSDKIEETRRIRHDIKFHVCAIRAFVNKQDYPSLLQYIESDDLQLDDTVLSFCNHPTLNILFSYYRDIAKQNDIAFAVSANVASEVFLSNNELWVLLGNLLENAVEATKYMHKANRKIQVKMHANKTSVVLTVDNLYQESKLNRDGETFVSTKQNGGVGLKSVSFLAEKYNGMATFETKDGWFLASVTMYH